MLLPREAREGLMRAWLEILREKHPGVAWVPVAEAAPPEDHPSPAMPESRLPWRHRGQMGGRVGQTVLHGRPFSLSWAARFQMQRSLALQSLQNSAGRARGR